MPSNAALSQKACVAIHVEGHCDLDLYQIDPKISREHLFSITNVCMKFEKTGPNLTLVIDRTRKYDTDGKTDRQVQSNIPSPSPSSLKGGHKKLYLVASPTRETKQQEDY